MNNEYTYWDGVLLQSLAIRVKLIHGPNITTYIKIPMLPLIQPWSRPVPLGWLFIYCARWIAHWSQSWLLHLVTHLEELIKSCNQPSSALCYLALPRSISKIHAWSMYTQHHMNTDIRGRACCAVELIDCDQKRWGLYASHPDVGCVVTECHGNS